MIQDILPLQFNNHYEEKEIREEDYVLAYDGARVLIKNNQENLEFLTYGECTRKEKEDYIIKRLKNPDADNKKILAPSEGLYLYKVNY